MLIEFEEDKDRKNRRVHGLPLSFARYVLADVQRLERIDDRIDYGEERIQAFGRVSERVFICIYVEREPALHIISLRKANARETRTYYEAQDPFGW